MTRRAKLFVSAGEASGDHHAAKLVAELLRIAPDTDVLAFGGPELEAAGADVRFPLTDLAVMGFKKVFENLGHFVGVLRDFDELLARERPDAVVLTDYPGLHLRFARLAKRRGIPVVYFICPQLWAWAPWRAARFRRVVDHALTILPFEERYFADLGLEARFIGHPSADGLAEWTPDARDLEVEADVRSGATPIAILPGSRRQEVSANLPLMLKVVRRLKAELPGLRVHLPQSSRPAVRELCAELLAGEPDLGVIQTDRVHPVLRAVRFALVASGTATYEVAWHGVPMVVLYRITKLQRRLGGLLLTVPWISQVNLIAGRELVPEFVTPDEPVEELAAACRERIVDGPVRDAFEGARETDLRDAFAPGASARAAAAVAAFLRDATASTDP